MVKIVQKSKSIALEEQLTILKLMEVKTWPPTIKVQSQKGKTPIKKPLI